MTHPQLLQLPTDDLVPNPWNTNQVSPDNEAKLEESIRRNGLFKPIIVREILDEEGRVVYEIVGGQHRWEVAGRVGLTEVPVVNLGAIDDLRAKEISVIDNTRYGADDTLGFAELLKEIGEASELQDFLPYTDADFKSIFSATDIALDELGIAPDDENSLDAPDETAASKPVRTHTILRFKVSLLDAERMSALIAQTQKIHDFRSSDDLTNAGDALVHLLMDQLPTDTTPPMSDLDELEAILDAVKE